MGIVQMNNNGSVTREFAELNHHMVDDHKKIRDRVTGEGQEQSEEYESQINEDAEDAYDERVEPVQVQAHAQDFLQRPQQQQPREPVVRWERFLPLRSLKVLLVEHDDSTRHVVNALLRNCGYEVVAVANGLQAWKILEDLTSHIDLVLTEVEPCLSGIALLYKIMSHKTRKNIPVIILCAVMSSHDSMGIVFKCLSKGAVDFLVKPIRKNELKNLWQHIWRRCHSSSGSGSESGIRTQKSIKSKSVEESDNNTGSNDEAGIRSIGVNIRDGSDNGSGTQQSSWTKRAVEVDSPQPQSPWDQSEPQDSTCAQVIHPRPEACSNNCVPVTATKECQEQDDKLDKVVMGKDLEIGVPKGPSMPLEDPAGIALTNKEAIDKGKFHAVNSRESYEHIDNVELELNSGKQTCESRNQAATNSSNPQTGREDVGNQDGLSKVSNIVIHATKEMPSLELSLKRQRDIGDGAPAHDRNVLRHSDLSAFSRYNSALVANQALTGNVDSCSPVDNNSSEAAKTESMQNFQSNSNISPPNQRSNGSSNNNDMGSTTNSIFAKTAAISDKPGPKSTVKAPHPSGFLSIQDSQVTAPQGVVQGKPDTVIPDIALAQTRGVQQQFQVQHHHHHYHHHHHHVHNTKQKQQQQQLTNNVDVSLETMTEEGPKSGSSNRLSAPITGDAGNHSLNVSGTGSNRGSNEQNMTSAILNAEGTDKECDNNEGAAKGGSDGGIGFRIMTEVDQSRFAQREAALQKFRQKRKERCFEKKVRYHSRQKLAEQRPRVRGQFVRQAMQDNNKGKDTLS